MLLFTCCVLYVATDRIYATVVRRRHHLVRRSDNGFDPEEYTQHPERYASTFSVKVCLITILPILPIDFQCHMTPCTDYVCVVRILCMYMYYTDCALCISHH